MFIWASKLKIKLSGNKIYSSLMSGRVLRYSPVEIEKKEMYSSVKYNSVTANVECLTSIVLRNHKNTGFGILLS